MSRVMRRVHGSRRRLRVARRDGVRIPHGRHRHFVRRRGNAEELARSLHEPFSTGDVEQLDAVFAPDWESIPVVEGQEQGPNRE